MKEYKIVESAKGYFFAINDNFEREVTWWMGQGWEVTGGVSIVMHENGTMTMIQAMVK